MVSYCTTELSFWGIDFDRIFEYERSLIIRNLPGSDLGTTPKGDNTNGVYGGVKNGPAIRLDTAYRETTPKTIHQISS